MIKQHYFEYQGQRIYPKVLMSPASVEYQRKRDALIPMAEEYANQQMYVAKGVGKKTNWSLEFLTKMDRLAEEEGLICNTPI